MKRYKSSIFKSFDEWGKLCTKIGVKTRGRDLDDIVKDVEHISDINHKKIQELNDILNSCQNLLCSIYDTEDILINKKDKPIKRYVYVIRGENGRYKIGVSGDVDRRIRELSLSSCEEHSFVLKALVNNPISVEKDLHKMFSGKRTHTEWFILDDEDIDFISSYLKRIEVTR